VYVAIIIILKKIIISIFFSLLFFFFFLLLFFKLYLGILTQNIHLDICTGKDTFQAIKQAYIVGFATETIKHNSEEIRERIA